MFPVLIVILVVFFLVMFQAISSQAVTVQKAHAWLVEEQKAVVESGITLDEFPTPADGNGSIRNTGFVPLNDVWLTVLSNGTSSHFLTTTLSQSENMNFSASVEYADLVLVSSKENFWVFPVSPVPRFINGASVELAEAALLLVSTPTTSAAFIDGVPRADLLAALQSPGGTNYTLTSNDIAKSVELHFSTNPCHALGAFLTVHALAGDELTIRTHNGYEFVDVYTCRFPPMECRTPNLSGWLNQDGTDFMIQLGHSDEAPVTLDYSEFDLRCT